MNGSLVTLDVYSINHMNSVFELKNSQEMAIVIDVNGAKPPNIVGKDVYILGLAENGIVPAGQAKTADEVKDNCLNGNGYFCLKYVINNNWGIDTKAWQR